MKKLFSLASLLLCAVSISATTTHQKELKELDRLLEVRDKYLSARLHTIEELKAQLPAATSYTEQFDLLEKITMQYKGLQCDSLLLYGYKMVDLARENNDSERLVKAQIQLARTQIKSGLHEESSITLNEIVYDEIPENLLEAYYWTKSNLYRTKSYITKDTRIARTVFMPKSRMYRDSLEAVKSPAGQYYYDITVDNLMSDGRYEEVISLSESELAGKDVTYFGYGNTWYNIASAKGNLGDVDGQISAYIESAISDVIRATKDHASLHKIAQYLFANGDVERSARYMQICMDDAMYFNANLRGIQIGQTIPVVIEAYNRRNARQMTLLYILMSIALALLVSSLFFLNKSTRQRRQLASVKKKLEVANENLVALNAKLQESDYIKESYVAHFIRQNSDYITRTHDLLLQVNKAIRKGKVDEALDIISTALHDEDDVATFYDAFDKAFLSIFPDFVEKFNELLKEEYKYDVKNFMGENKNLSSELRVYALVRLGFNDSATLAEMLRYSVNSIYNIRSKAKAKSSIPKDKFEEMVRKIGVM